MRLTLAEAQPDHRAAVLLLWARRAFDMVVVGAMVLAVGDTVSFLRGLVG